MNRKMIVLMMSVLLGINNLRAQGIDFNHLSLDEALQKAKTEKKLVFIDFYTAWCGPCKSMAKYVFPLPEVGNVYNKYFVSVELDAEKEGLQAAKKYQVTAYPTFLFLNPEGKVVYKETGLRPVKDFIDLANKTVASISSEYSLQKLKEEFPNRQNDPQFLKIYFHKMIQYGQDAAAVQGIEAWLKVQKEIKEHDVDMMDFLLQNSRYLVSGGKAEAVLDANYAEYMDIATKMEALELERLKPTMAQKTRDLAFAANDTAMFKTFIKAFKRLPAKYQKNGNLMDYNLAYYAMAKNDAAFKKLAEIYVDSLMNAETIEQVKKDDQASYQKYKDQYAKTPSPDLAKLVEISKSGLKTLKLEREIAEKGASYLNRISTDNEYKKLASWIDYGYKLQPDNCYSNDLQADMLFKQGKTKQAIVLKTKAVENWPATDKKLVNKKYELEKMTKSTTK